MPVLTINHFRFGLDDNSHMSHMFVVAEDTNWSTFSQVNTTFLIRFNEQMGASALANVDFQFLAKLNAGAWFSIATSSSVVKAVTPTAFADAANLTQRLSGSGTFESSGAGGTVDGLSGGTQNDIAAAGCSETELAFQIVGGSVVNGDLIYFGGSSPDTSVAMSVTPFIVIAGLATGINRRIGNGVSAGFLAGVGR